MSYVIEPYRSCSSTQRAGFTTQAVAQGIKTTQEHLLLTRLKDLREDGEVEWRKKGNGYEWKAC
jgi:hypothetical protein